jgi:hypothetical protein
LKLQFNRVEGKHAEQVNYGHLGVVARAQRSKMSRVPFKLGTFIFRMYR